MHTAPLYHAGGRHPGPQCCGVVPHSNLYMLALCPHIRGAREHNTTCLPINRFLLNACHGCLLNPSQFVRPKPPPFIHTSLA